MAGKWFYKVGDQEIGPLTSKQLKQLADEGRLAQTDPVRQEDSTMWVTARSVKGLFTESSARSAPAAPSVPVTPTAPSAPAAAENSTGVKSGSPSDPMTSVTRRRVLVAKPLKDDSAIPQGKPAVKPGVATQVGIPKVGGSDFSSSTSSTSSKPRGINVIQDASTIRKTTRVPKGLSINTTSTTNLRTGIRKGPLVTSSETAGEDGDSGAPMDLASRRKKKQLQQIYILSGALGLVILTAGILLYMFNSPQEEPSEKKVASNAENQLVEETASEEVQADNPEGTSPDAAAEEEMDADNFGKGPSEEASGEPVKDILGVPSTDWKKIPEDSADYKKMSVKIGDISVKVEKAFIGTPPLIDRSGRLVKPDKGEYLVINLLLRNSSREKVYPYSGWSVMKQGVSLRDNLGNEYKRKSFRESKCYVEDQITSETQLSNMLNDVIVFTRPAPAAQVLLLELPSITGGNSYKIYIPAQAYGGDTGNTLTASEEENAGEETRPADPETESSDRPVTRSESPEHRKTDDVMGDLLPTSETEVTEEESVPEEETTEKNSVTSEDADGTESQDPMPESSEGVSHEAAAPDLDEGELEFQQLRREMGLNEDEQEEGADIQLDPTQKKSMEEIQKKSDKAREEKNKKKFKNR